MGFTHGANMFGVSKPLTMDFKSSNEHFMALYADYTAPVRLHQGSALEDAPWVLSPMSLRPTMTRSCQLTVSSLFGIGDVDDHWISLVCV